MSENNAATSDPDDYRFLGPTKPLSMLPPDESTLQRNEAFVADLESAEEVTHAVAINLQSLLEKLRQLSLAFVQAEAHQCGYGREGWWADVRLFGSSALGAGIGCSDVDCMVLVPDVVEPQAFFQKFPSFLAGAAAERVVAITATRVPVLRLRLGGVDIDMLCVCFDLRAPPSDEQLLNNSIFDCVTPDTRSSLNGVRTALWLVRLVPNTETFRTVLRAVKLWAMRMYPSSGAPALRLPPLFLSSSRSPE